ncbi:uncharacterized protein LOC141598853 isoform X2 [Silene latifolia]|uniref:uncharacterized protein LOC141598853 isoform X2 n=1 Tax=Silene latifolia TaxID=37657 RepID=UPI003D78A7A6
MACYMLESDKQFLCCKDTQTLEVYEIDNLYIAPVRQKYWTHVETVQSEEGQEFELFKIGDGEIIAGCELEALMKDLMCLGMMVNREGLCFLKNPQINILDQCQVEYYRMFDLFDWSKYDVKSRLNTRWVRNDIVTGRPILEMLGKDAELIENKRLHLGELAELKCKHSQDIEDLKGNHSKDIHELEQKHLSNFAEFQLKIDEELKAKQAEIMEILKDFTPN